MAQDDTVGLQAAHGPWWLRSIAVLRGASTPRPTGSRTRGWATRCALSLALVVVAMLGPAAASALAASLPTSVTGEATEVKQTSATLNATVNPNGAEVTKCEFEYGTSESYGHIMPCSSLPGSGTSPVAVSAALTGLAANTPYHFRISATNSEGTGKGADKEFKTRNAPTVEVRPAAAITLTSATLNATVNPNGVEVTKCEFEYGTSESYGLSMPCSSLPGSGAAPVAVSAVVTGLMMHTEYHFRISATNGTGTEKSSDERFTTLPVAPAVEGEAASELSQTSAALTATVNPNGAEVTKCEFEYGTSESYGLSVPCTSLPGSGTTPVAVAAALTGLSANTTYDFRISATNGQGTSKGLGSTFKTSPNAPTVETLAASGVALSSATLHATINPNGSEVSECKFEYGTTIGYGASVPCLILPGAGTSPVAVSAVLVALTANTTYHFRIVAGNGGAPVAGADQTFLTLSTVTVTPTPTPKPTPTPTPSSNFNLPASALVNGKTGATTFQVSVSDPGTLRWMLTFSNGKFGAFSASNVKCKRGQIKLAGKCRPSTIVFAKGSQTATAPGIVAFTAKPSASAVKALKTALKHNKGLPVLLTLTFQSARGGLPVSHSGSLSIKLKKK